jgi:D-lactate dehydrogenase (cytochrome)
VVRVSREWRVPIVPYSGATSLEGHFAGVSGIDLPICILNYCALYVQTSSGSICLDMSGMDQILHINGVLFRLIHSTQNVN